MTFLKIRCNVCKNIMVVSSKPPENVNGLVLSELICENCGNNYFIPAPTEYKIKQSYEFCPVDKSSILFYIDNGSITKFWSSQNCSRCRMSNSCLVIKNHKKLIYI